MYKYNTSFANNCDRMIIKWLSKVRVDKIYLGHPGFADDFADMVIISVSKETLASYIWYLLIVT